jgi:hypothetical protein
MTTESNAPRWTARLDAFKSTKDPGFQDQLRIIAAYYEMYERGYRFMGPWISRQIGSQLPSIPPDTATIANCIGKPRSVIHSFAYNAFVDALHRFAAQSKGKRQLISPDQSSHHSAQFPRGTFSIEKVENVQLASSQGGYKSLHAIQLFGSGSPLYVKDLQLNSDDIGFIIIRPKLGKLGTASTMNWEVLFYRTPHGYLIDHVDSNLNPRWSGLR